MKRYENIGISVKRIIGISEEKEANIGISVENIEIIGYRDSQKYLSIVKKIKESEYQKKKKKHRSIRNHTQTVTVFARQV